MTIIPEWCCDACGTWNKKDETCPCGTNEESWAPITPAYRIHIVDRESPS